MVIEPNNGEMRREHDELEAFSHLKITRGIDGDPEGQEGRGGEVQGDLRIVLATIVARQRERDCGSSGRRR